MRLLVVEDEPHWQRAIEAVVASRPEYRIVSLCSNVQQGNEAIAREDFDLLIVDLGLPDGSGIDVIRTARRSRPDADILVATVFADEGNVVAAIYAGATGYLLKESTQEQWIAAIEDLRAGRSPIDPKVARHILGAIRLQGRSAEAGSATKTSVAGPEAGAATDVKLSPREIEVLQLVAKGFTMVEVGKFLNISPNTTRTHAKSIYRKLEVSTRGEAVFEASLLGLI